MRTILNVHWVFTGYRTHSEGNTNTTHLTLGVPTHKSSSVGEVGGQITASSIQEVSQFTEGPALAYLKKKGREMKKIQKEKNKKTKREKKEEKKAKKKVMKRKKIEKKIDKKEK